MAWTLTGVAEVSTIQLIDFTGTQGQPAQHQRKIPVFALSNFDGHSHLMCLRDA
jgi:hypothetical protein